MSSEHHVAFICPFGSVRGTPGPARLPGHCADEACANVYHGLLATWNIISFQSRPLVRLSVRLSPDACLTILMGPVGSRLLRYANFTSRIQPDLIIALNKAPFKLITFPPSIRDQRRSKESLIKFIHPIKLESKTTSIMRQSIKCVLQWRVPLKCFSLTMIEFSSN